MRFYAYGNDLIKILVVFGDFVILNMILIGYIELVPSIVPKFFDVATKMTALVANFSMAIAEYFYRTIIHYRYVTVEQVLGRVFRLCAVQVVIMFVCLRMLSESGSFFTFMLIFGTTEFVSILLSRSCERAVLEHYRRSGRNTRSVVLVGSDPANLMVYKELISDPATGYRILGYFSDEEIADCPAKLKRLGSLNDLDREMDATVNETATDPLDQGQKNIEDSLPRADDLFCCLSHDASQEIVKIMRYCDKNVIHFFYVPRQFGNFRLNLKPEQFGKINMFTNHREPLSYPVNQFMKRTFDIVVSGLVCLFLIPFIPLLALIIKIQSPGPVFFRQARTGLNGKTFQCLKFRSMYVNKNADSVQATKDDPRKFPFGNFMRKTNIDEFPQFFNVLKGDMSIVGPRPHMLHHTEIYSQLIDKYMVRHFCKPGITGYAQISGFRGETKELWQMEERIRRDIWYIENWTFFLDIRIIILTAKSLIIPDKNAY